MPNIMMIIILIIMINDNLTDMVIRKSCVKSGKVWSPRFLASGHLADERTQALLASDHHDIDQNMRFMIIGKNHYVFLKILPAEPKKRSVGDLPLASVSLTD